MVAILSTIFFLLFTGFVGALAGTELVNGKRIIALGSSISPNSISTSWPSPSGLFELGFYKQGSGFAVGIWIVGVKKNTVVWTANRDDPPIASNAKLQLTMEGKLLLQTEQGQVKLIANATATAFSASMLDSGNFVLYGQNSNVIWQSFDYPTDTIVGGQVLPAGRELFSSSSETNHSTGKFHLSMQLDGNLVSYPINTGTTWDAYWATDTWRYGNLHLYLNKTGLLVLRNNTNFDTVRLVYEDHLSSSSTDSIIYRATLDSDGIFRLYTHVHDGSRELRVLNRWSALDDSCKVKGICGYNSYCTHDDTRQYCNCLEGFALIDPNDSTRGCKRNFSEGECSDGKVDATSYNMIPMVKMAWLDFPYSNLQMQKEDCSLSCLEDCACAAARYESNMCKKQELPLMYISRNQEESSTIFIKVGTKSLKTSNHTEPQNEPHRPPPIRSTSNTAIVQIVLVILIFAAFLCSTVVISSHLIHRIQVLRYKRLLEIGDLGLNEEVALRTFSYSELKRATNNFKEELGKGSFGAVYKGALNKGRRLIAVKRLEKLVEEGEREFQAEMRAIGKTHHRNLVRLLGYCAEGSKRLLVYEYMRNGSLGKLLFGAERRPYWDDRARIALEVARGILYLHEECKAPIIHCDIKPQNILMDEIWTAKISDFGLAKLLMPDQTRTFTMVRGTRGYLAPEWQRNTPISVKADVYSYGIVLMEIICCRRNLDANVSEPEEILLSSWVYKCFVGRELSKLVHWDDVDKNVLENMVKVALWCIQDEPALRPTMKSVVLMLEGITHISVPPCPTAAPS